MGVICPYCLNPAENVGGERIYPHNEEMHAERFWFCAPCDAYVRCLPSGKPAGTLADFDTREARIAAYAAVSYLVETESVDRGDVMEWVAVNLGLPPYDCHIGRMDADMCRQVVRICKGG